LPLDEANLVVFDVETTGLDSKLDRIIEIGAQKIRGNKTIGEFSTLIRPDVPISDDVTRMTGITEEMLADQPCIEEILPEFIDYFGDSILVAHNAEFDISMLKAACSRIGVQLDWPCFCTLKMARQFLSQLENLKDTSYILPDDSIKPNWLAMPLMTKNRMGVLRYLEENGVQTRVTFAGNITRHPAYRNYLCDFPNSKSNFRTSSG